MRTKFRRIAKRKGKFFIALSLMIIAVGEGSSPCVKRSLKRGGAGGEPDDPLSRLGEQEVMLYD